MQHFFASHSYAAFFLGRNGQAVGIGFDDRTYIIASLAGGWSRPGRTAAVHSQSQPAASAQEDARSRAEAIAALIAQGRASLRKNPPAGDS